MSQVSRKNKKFIIFRSIKNKMDFSTWKVDSDPRQNLVDH